ncbi:peptidoglycan -binding protein [Thioclava sp. GXIMD4215]|uniref:peptidoglycan -binding protein n=1 Tax=Thioclava sp. GXIMD4215 TaxID=3131928 RepID=UPI003252287D
MALARRGRQRFSTNIWPGFVDAMTALLLVVIFVLSIFMVVQSVLRQQVNTQENELASLNDTVDGLAQALSLSRQKVGSLETKLTDAETEAQRQATLIANLTGQLRDRQSDLAAADSKITAFEAQVAHLLAAQKAQMQASDQKLRVSQATIDDLRTKLQVSGEEISTMTLALEEARRQAEDTLTKLAAAQAARDDLQGRLDSQLTEAERQAALQAVAEKALAEQKDISQDAARKVELLNQQIAALRGQLGQLQAVLDDSQTRSAASKSQIESLGTQLNSALAQLAAEQKRRASLEEAARKKAEAEAQDLASYRSEFFGRLSKILQGREGVKVVGDRFVFSSEVLFPQGSATLSDEGKAQIAQVTRLLDELSAEIPPQLDWIIRVDGHTDDVPLSGTGQYRDNWELSQARALSVVRYMIDSLKFPPNRLAATGFGQYRPVAKGDSPEARAANRRIELKLTER